MLRDKDFLTDSTVLKTRFQREDVKLTVTTVGMGKTIYIALGDTDNEHRIGFDEEQFDKLIEFLINFNQKMTVCQYEDSDIGPESWQEE